jgi:pSer/pThr/pTyr-binding forkhead associated (FHA) protein
MATAKLQLSFRIFKDGQLVRETQLSQGVIKIGKVTSAHLHLDDEHVSRMHAIIEVLGDEVSVIDLGSTGGTFVNGQRINKAKLQSGDVIGAGNSKIELSITAKAGEIVVPEPAFDPRNVIPMVTPVAATPAPVRAMPPALPHTVTMPVVATPAAVPAPVAATGSGPVAVAPMFQSTDTEDGGAKAVEVAAMLGDSVVGVKHCMDPRSGKVTRATWGFAAGGLACLLASGIAFGTSINTAANNKAALEQHIKMGKPAHAFRAELVGRGVDIIAFGGLLAGIVNLTIALARVRRERKSPYYRIGTAADVEMPLEQSPAPSFPLVAPKGDDFVFNYGAGIDGELVVDGKATTFAELVAQGRAKASTITAGAYELAIPAKARIKARAGQTTFLVSAVSKPKATAAPLFNLENRALVYGAGSLAAHLAVVAFLSTIPVADAGVNIDLASTENTSLRTTNSQKEDQVDEIEKSKEPGAEGSENPTTKMALQEGKAGDPSIAKEGSMEVKKRNDSDIHLSRDQAIEYARNAGVLGDVHAIETGIKSLTSDFDFSNGWSDRDIYGALKGEPGGGGRFGGGRSGDGPGGGCFGMECGTVPGSWNKIRINTRPGDEWGGPRDGWGKPRTRIGGVPPGGEPPRIKGDLDRAIIKRYIKRNFEKFSYCYESELLAKPGIEGSVMVSFLISGTGTVQQSVGKGFDDKVAVCVAGVIKNIEFPAPTDGGNVQVNYPFTFHAAGAQK